MGGRKGGEKLSDLENNCISKTGLKRNLSTPQKKGEREVILEIYYG